MLLIKKRETSFWDWPPFLSEVLDRETTNIWAADFHVRALLLRSVQNLYSKAGQGVLWLLLAVISGNATEVKGENN